MASAFSFVPAKMCSSCDAGSYFIPNIRERPYHMKDSVYNETMLSRLRNRTYRNSKVGAIRNLLQMNGSTGCSALQRIAALRDPDLHINDKIDGSKIRSYRFQTDNGGFVKVSIGAEQSTYIEVSDMPPSFNEHQLALCWQTLRADSLCKLELDNSQSSEIILTQTSPGQHISELEIDYPGVPIYLSFFIYSSLSADGFNRLVVRTARKTSFRVPVGFARGNPMPLGFTFCDDGSVNFSLFSKNAERVILCLFEDHSNKPNLEIDLDPYVHKTGDIWHVSLENVQNYISYGFRCEGNLLYNEGGDIVYLDPYARIVRSLSPGNKNFFLSCFLGNLKKVPSFDWSGDVHLCLPAEKLVVYRLNVGNFTRDESSCLPNDIAGTFSGIIEKIHHFKNLGVNVILLEPIFAFDENQGSYFPHSFFAPVNMYGPKGDGELAMNSMKEMVKCLHVNGIEVLLEVVFSHTAEGGETTHEGVGILGIDRLSYYGNDGKRSGVDSLLNCNKSIVQKMIVDSLRHWVIDFHVDGFSFVNASYFVQGASGHHSSRSSLIELIAIDPILSCTRLIADSWSPHDMLYHEIDFPHWQRWSEINTRFCKDARNFLRGEGLVSDLATRLCGSGDIFSDSRGPTFSRRWAKRREAMSVSTAAACLALPVCRLRSRHGLHRRISPCSSLKSGFFSNFSDGVASTRDRSSNAVEAVSIRGGTGRREEEAMKNTQSGHQNHIISTFSMSLIASQLLPSETLAALTPEESNTSSHILNSLLLMDLDPNTAKLAIGVIGPFLSAYGFLFIVRIVMSWYPKLPVGKFPYVLAYAPTEPVLVVTRKVIPPLGGVDVTPVVWFGLLSFLNEILVGPQGLLVLLSQQV